MFKSSVQRDNLSKKGVQTQNYSDVNLQNFTYDKIQGGGAPNNFLMKDRNSTESKVPFNNQSPRFKTTKGTVS